MQRKSTAGRPSGTDGSDFSYRMVVDSRYTKVTKRKSRLCLLIFVQAAIYLIGLSCAFPTRTKKDERNTLAIASAAIGLVSSLVGELGCRRSRENLLRLYTAASTIVMVLSVFCAVRSRLTIEERNSLGTRAKLELVGFICAQLGKTSRRFYSALHRVQASRYHLNYTFAETVVQILTIIVMNFLVNNMSPPTIIA